MPVDSTTAFRNVNVSKQTIPLPPGELLTTPGLAEQLQITDAEALKPGNLIPFLAGQSVKYNQIVAQPEIKTLAAEIPEYRPDLHAQASALTREEQGALSDWRNDVKAMLSVQSNPTGGTSGGTGSAGSSGGTSGGTSGNGGGTTEDVSKQIQQFIDDAAKSNPSAFSSKSTDPVDIISGMMDGTLFQETAESKRKYQELLASAKDPESVILALTWHESLKTSSMMGKAFEALKVQQDGLDKITAQMDLKGKTISEAELAKDNIITGKAMSGSQELYTGLNQLFSTYGQLFELSNSIERDIKQDRSTGIANFKL